MDKEPENNFEPSQQRRPRRLEDANSEEIRFPLVWIIIGGLAGLMVIGLVGLGVVNLVRQNAITPTPQVLPPLTQVLDTPAPIQPTPTLVQATATPVEAVAAPAETTDGTNATTDPELDFGPIVVTGYVRVVGTGGVGVSMRAGPGRNNARLGIAEEDEETVLLVLDGPRDDENAEDYIWWFIQHPDGAEGWVVEDFIVSAQAP